MTTFTLIITKTEQTLNGVALSVKERRAMFLYRNPEVVTHRTTLYSKTFRTSKAAWAAATPELVDSCGVVYFENGTIGAEFTDYDVDVIRQA